MTEIGRDPEGRAYFALRYQHGCTDTLPWGREPFDCIVFSCNEGPIELIANELAATAAEWIQVAGVTAEFVHDAIDRAAVSSGRQTAIGDGSPMTTWHAEDRSPAQMTDVALNCFGGCDRILIIVVGDEQAFAESVRSLSGALRGKRGHF